MSNDYYNASGTPGTGTFAASAPIRSEYSAIAAGFDLLPTLSAGTASKAVVINPGGTAITTTTGTLALAGNFATTGSFATTLIAGADVSLTLPVVSGTLATLAGTETLSNKTLVAPALGTPASGVLTNCTGIPVSAATGILAVANGGTGTSTAFTAGSVVFAGASGVYSQSNANLFWDNSINQLRVSGAAATSVFQASKGGAAPGVVGSFLAPDVTNGNFVDIRIGKTVATNNEAVVLKFIYGTSTSTFDVSIFGDSGSLVIAKGGAITIASTLNNVAITAPASTATLTLGSGKTVTISNTLTLTGTDGSTLAIGAGGTLGSNAYTSTAYAPVASPTFTGTATAPTFNASTQLNVGGSKAIDITSDFMQFYSGTRNGLTIGNSSETTYINANTTLFRLSDASTVVATLTSSSLALGSGVALQLSNAFVGTPVTSAGYIIIKDSGGTDRKVMVGT